MKPAPVLRLTLAALCAVWFAGLIRFAADIPDTPARETSKTDAIIVLTGGSGRVEAGFALWSEGRGGKLFISGVGKGVNLKEIYRLAGRQTPESSGKATAATRVVLGHEATDTRGNARETATWMVKEGFSSARLVTANYHLPRSLMEFSRAMPHIRFVPEPVFPPEFQMRQWWRRPGTARLIFLEYHKTMASRVEHFIQDEILR